MAVAVIDGHAVLPAVGAVRDGDFVGALGTSAAFMLQSQAFRPLPPGMEGVARGGALPGLWTYEGGTPAFGDALAWLAGLARPGMDLGAALAEMDARAAALPPGRLLALDWWGGSRFLADARLSGAILGLRPDTPPEAIHRALVESLAFGARAVLDALEGGGLPAGRIILTSGLAERSPFLLGVMADVLGRPVLVPRLLHATAVGAAIHGAVAGGVVAGYEEGAARFGAREVAVVEPRRPGAFEAAFRHYRALAGDAALLAAMRHLGGQA